jgi:uncharacterized protein YktB (UPF0637 family)
MNKNAAAALEPSSVTDPRTGRVIRVSVPVRIKYRKYFQGQTVGLSTREVLHTLSNRELNDEIAKDFAASANDVAHMFISKDSDKNANPPRIVWMEIRKQQRGSRAIFNFFISKINEGFIDILTVTQTYKKPTRPRIVQAEDRMIKNLLDMLVEERLEKMAKKSDGKQGQNTAELIAAVKAKGKNLTKSKKEINDVIAMIKGIEESGLKAKKSKEYIRRTINDKLPKWCIEEVTKMHGPGKSGRKSD